MIRKELQVTYRCRTGNSISKRKEGRLDKIDNGLYPNAIGLPDKSYVEIEGTTTTDGIIFNTGWASADLVKIEFD
jgi:hypothetical protein